MIGWLMSCIKRDPVGGLRGQGWAIGDEPQLEKNLCDRFEKKICLNLADGLGSIWGRSSSSRRYEAKLSFQALGPEDEACRLPINITSKAPGNLKLISNFAATPFELDGLRYGSIEAFWQGLKFPDEARRRELAPLHGAKAKDAGFSAPQADTIIYAGQTVRVGTWEHWQLMERATVAKFAQNVTARDVLLSTGERPLMHQMKNDSRTIPERSSPRYGCGVEPACGAQATEASFNGPPCWGGRGGLTCLGHVEERAHDSRVQEYRAAGEGCPQRG